MKIRKKLPPIGYVVYVSVNFVIILQRISQIFLFQFIVVNILIQCHSFPESLTSQTLVTHSMQQSSSSEANWFAASQEIPRISRNPKVHYRTHKCPPPVPIPSHLDPVHTPTSYFLKIHLNIILPSTPGSPKWYLSLRFPHQNPVYTSPP